VLLFIERELYDIARLSVCCLSVTLMHRHPTRAVVIFCNISTAFIIIIIIIIIQYLYSPLKSCRGYRGYLLGHQLLSTENFTEIIRGEPFRRGS